MFRNQDPTASAYVVIGSGPPPHTGQSIFLAYIAGLLARSDCEVIKLRTRQSQRHWGAAILKAVHAAMLMIRLLLGPQRTSAVIVLETKLGLCVNILECLVLRLKGARLFLSHHSFACINRHDRLMRMVQTVAGRSAVNLFLCDCMASRFTSTYPAVKERRWLVLNNVGRIEQDEIPSSLEAKPAQLTLGFISNISFEKGIAEVFDLLRAVRQGGRSVHAIIAGPIPDPDVKAYVLRRIAESDGSAKWIGPVYGRDKADFLERVHLMVFPTKYAVEAQPNVLLEALRFGIPCLTTDRGCIAEDLEGSGSFVARDCQSFVEGASAFVVQAAEQLDAGYWAKVSNQARRRYLALRDRDASSQATFRSMFFGDTVRHAPSWSHAAPSFHTQQG